MVEKTHTVGWAPNVYEPLKKTAGATGDWLAPKSDALSAPDAYYISIELPGVLPEKVDITLAEQSLTVRGEKRSERGEEGANYFFSEREYGAFQRTFRLPPDSDTDKIDASFIDGVVKITIPRVREAARTERNIPVRRPEASVTGRPLGEA